MTIAPHIQRPPSNFGRALLEALLIMFLIFIGWALMMTLYTGRWDGPRAASGPIFERLLISTEIGESVLSADGSPVIDSEGYRVIGPFRPGVTCPCTVKIQTPPLDPAEQVLARVPGILEAALAGTVALLLLLIVRSTRVGSPFTMKNVRRLRAIGGILIVASFLVPVVNNIVATELLDGAASGTVFAFTLSFLPALAGAAFFALAWVWNQGVRLAADAEGLV